MTRRAIRLPLALLLFALLVPIGLGAPAIPDLLHGAGAASTFQVIAHGQALEGGLYDWNDLCASCLIRVTLGAGTFVASGNDFAAQLSPGVYEIREFVGLFAFTQNGPHDFDVEFHGLGKLARLE